MNMPTMHRILITVFFLFLFGQLPARKYFEFTPRARSAYDLVTGLRFEEANSILARLRLQDPDNLIVHHIENYMDFFRVYINEDEEEYKRLKKNRDRRLEKVAMGDPSSPYFLFVQADIRLQWALLRLRFEDYLGAFSEVNKAHKLLKENKKKFPHFMANQKDLAILHAMIGTIPDNYKWGVKLLSGLDGTIAQGRREIEEVVEYARKHDFIFEKETHVLYAFLLLHLDNQAEKAWQVINDAGLAPRQNPIHCFVMANIAMRTNRNDRAIEILEGRPRNPALMPLPYLDFMLGTAKLRRLDSDAGPHFLRFVERFKGRNFIKEAYQKLAWQELIRNNPAGYKKFMQLCSQKGHDASGGDRNALKEALDGFVPNLDLLKARLLFDGGYYGQAFRLLQNKKPENLPDKRSRLEYSYRMGRILHGMKRYGEALSFYRQTIALGRNETYFFACNAALQIGLICEEQGNIAGAIESFNLCLSLKPDEYRTGLHQKAKAGLARLK